MRQIGRSGGSHILITGASGFIGLNIIDKLLSDTNDYIYALYHKKSSSDIFKEAFPNIKRLKFYSGSLSDAELLKEIIEEVKPEYVIHLAGTVNLEKSYSVATSCIESNVKGTVNLLEAIKDISIKRFVYCSTLDVYGRGNTPFVETQEVDVVTPYSITKLTGEMFSNLYHKLYTVPVVILRLSNIYGPWQKKERLIPMLILASLRGEDIQLNSGEYRKDFCYVADVVDAILKSLYSDTVTNEIINVGSGKAVKIFDIAKIVVDETESKSNIIVKKNSKRALENPVSYCNCIKAQKLLLWTPKVDLREGLRLTISWYKSNSWRM